MPGLQLTEAQARRVWDFEGNTCSLVPATLSEAHAERHERFIAQPFEESGQCDAETEARL